MSADLLRRAARVARETAEAATDGPWRNAMHAALWHPVVARAVAALTECAAGADPSEREMVAAARCGMCGSDHLTEIARALLKEGTTDEHS